MADQPQTQLFIGDWRVSPALDQIERAGETVKLEPRTMRLLMRLAATPGDVVSGQQLLEDVWAGVVVSSQSVYQAVSQLRKLLGDVNEAPTYIATVPRKGYRLIAPVRALPLESALLQDAGSPDQSPDGEVRDSPAGRPWSPALDGERRAKHGAPARTRTWVLAAAAICIAALSYLWIRDTATSDLRKASVVVLPFADMTDGSKEPAFIDGLTEEVSSSLAQLPALRVIARTSAYAVRDQKLDAQQIGKKLSATHMIEGAVRKSGQSIRVTAQLIDTQRGHRVWSETYDLPAQDILRLQSDIGRAVAQALDIRFSEQDSRRLRARNARSAEAYELYLIARHHYRQRTLTDNARALELNRKAISLDPGFGLAYVGLALAMLNEAILQGSAVEAVAPEVERLTDTALKVNPELAEAHAAQGLLYRQLYDYERARTHLLQAVRLDPSNVAALAGLGVLEEYQGRPLNALSYYDQAAQLDPLDFLRHVRRCIGLTDVGDYEQANAACDAARGLKSDAAWVYIAAVGLARAQGRLADALALSGAGLAASPNSVELLKQRLDDLENMGLLNDARSVISRVRALENDSAWADLSEAGILLLEGKRDEAHRRVTRLTLDQQASAATLRHAALLLLMVKDFATAERLLYMADNAGDAKEVKAREFSDLRGGFSHQVTLASAEKMQGKSQRAKERMQLMLKQLQTLEANGFRGWALHALRGDALAILDDANGAMAALEQAASLGWRRTYHVRLAPHFSSLAERRDMQELLARMDKWMLAEQRLLPTG